MQATTSAVARSNVRIEGRDDGPVLLFAHGFGCDQGMWRRVLPRFTDAHRVVLLDLVGAGGSDPGDYDRQRYSSLEGHAEDVVDVLEELDLRDVTLVGHSVSSMIVLLASVAAPERVARTILVAPSPRYIDDPETGYVGGFSQADVEGLLASMDSNYFAWAASLAPMVMGNAEEPELAEELSGSFCRTDPDTARDLAHATFLSDHRDLLPRVTVPSLVLQCSDDLLAPLAVGQYVHRHLPSSTFVQLAATGHCPHVSAPDETAAAILAYLGTAP